MLPLLPRQQDPFIWWKQYANEYSNIKKLAVMYLSPPPSSVNSERLFSAVGSTYTENRNRSSLDNEQNIMKKNRRFHVLMRYNE